MKKLFPGILAMLLCFGCLVGCGDKTPDSTPDSTPNDSTPVVPDVPAQEHDGDLKQVKDAVLVPLASYDSTSNKDYTVPNSYSFYGEEAVYDISWAVTDAEGNAVTGVTVEAGTGATDVVKISVDEDTPYVLKATVTCPDGCCTLEYTLNRTASAAPVPVAITEAPVEDVAYKLYVYEGSAGKDCFPTGEPKSDKYPYYWLTTSDYAASIDLYVTNVEGGFNLYHVVDGTNVYLNIVKVGTYTNSLYQTLEDNATPSVWKYDATMGTIVVDLDGSTCYLGCDGGYDTIEAQYKTGDGYYVAYLCTMKDKSEVVITDQDKVDTTLDELKVAPKYTLDKSVTLATSGTKYEEVSVSWSVEADKGATLSANILDLVIPAEKTMVKLTATVSCGEVTETKEFDLELGPKSVEITDKTDVAAILAAINNLAEGETLPGTYTLSGEITKVNTPWDAGFKNITVTIKIDDENSLECYRLKSGEADASALKVGDTITVSGSIKNHYGKLEFDAGCTLDAVTTGSTGGEDIGGGEGDEGNTGSEYTVMTITEALAAAEGTKVEISGTVNKLYEEWSSYNNMSPYITDGTVEILVFRTTTKVSIGDVITVKGVITAYNSVNQIAQAGSIVEITQAHTCTDFNEATCQSPATCTVCGTAQAGSAVVDHVYENGACKWCTAPEGVETFTASVSIPDYAAANSWVNQTKYTSIDLDDNVTVTVAGGSNSGKYYTSGNAWRIYASDSPAGSLTISVDEGYELVSIKVTTDTGTYAYLCVDGTTDDISNETVAVSGSSVLLNTVKNGSDGKQVRVKAIEVIYKAV